MYIYNYETFLLLEHSKSDPIPELTWKKKGKTIIFLLGIPGAGKSTFSKKFLIPKLKNYKIFDPDELQKQLKKLGKMEYERTDIEIGEKKEDIKKAMKKFNDEYNISVELTDKEIDDIISNNLFFEQNDRILENKFLMFMEHSNSDIIYDTTGNNINNIKRYTIKAKENGYTVVYIKVKSSVEYAVVGNIKRPRTVQPDYQLSTIERSEEMERSFLNLQPDAYYIYNRENNEILPVEEYWHKDSSAAYDIILNDNFYNSQLMDSVMDGFDEEKVRETIYNICKLIYNNNKITSLNKSLVDDVYEKLEKSGIFEEYK